MSPPTPRDGLAPIHHAILEQDHARVSRLLQSPNAADLRTAGGETPLMLACLVGDIKSFRLLMSKGADYAAKDASGRSARSYARKSEFGEARLARYDCAPLSQAAATRQRQLCRFLGNPGELRSQHRRGRHALSSAILFRHRRTVTLLRPDRRLKTRKRMEQGTTGFLALEADSAPRAFAISGWSAGKPTSPRLLHNAEYTELVRDFSRRIAFRLPRSQDDNGGFAAAEEHFGRNAACHVEKQLALYWVRLKLRELFGQVDYAKISDLGQANPPAEREVWLFLDHYPCWKFLSRIRRLTGITFIVEPVKFVTQGTRRQPYTGCENCSCEKCLEKRQAAGTDVQPRDNEDEGPSRSGNDGEDEEEHDDDDDDDDDDEMPYTPTRAQRRPRDESHPAQQVQPTRGPAEWVSYAGNLLIPPYSKPPKRPRGSASDENAAYWIQQSQEPSALSSSAATARSRSSLPDPISCHAGRSLHFASPAADDVSVPVSTGGSESGVRRIQVQIPALSPARKSLFRRLPDADAEGTAASRAGVRCGVSGRPRLFSELEAETEPDQETETRTPRARQRPSFPRRPRPGGRTIQEAQRTLQLQRFSYKPAAAAPPPPPPPPSQPQSLPTSPTTPLAQRNTNLSHNTLPKPHTRTTTAKTTTSSSPTPAQKANRPASNRPARSRPANTRAEKRAEKLRRTSTFSKAVDFYRTRQAGPAGAAGPEPGGREQRLAGAAAASSVDGNGDSGNAFYLSALDLVSEDG